MLAMERKCAPIMGVQCGNYYYSTPPPSPPQHACAHPASNQSVEGAKQSQQGCGLGVAQGRLEGGAAREGLAGVEADRVGVDDRDGTEYVTGTGKLGFAFLVRSRRATSM